MSKEAIILDNIGKLYRLGRVGSGTLVKDFNRFLASVMRKEDPYAKLAGVNDRTRKASSEMVWALRGINFDVHHGEVLGIIGRNGAGKSTLLKILSKITTPTTGKIRISGRIASLLEVGTGFHPEMTGKENIFLNGAILGMRKHEIRKKFDAIVDFAGVSAYIDTPVKRYSSGMYVRLAFAVAAYLEPEILIVDEVLAVGDAEFQKKCLGRMKEVSVNEGRTVLFVSHNMAAVKTLCNRVVVLENGELTFNGQVDAGVGYYLNGNELTGGNKKLIQGVEIRGLFRLDEVSASNENAESSNPLFENKPIDIKTKIFIESDDATRYHLTYHMLNEFGEVMFSFSNANHVPLKKGENNLVAKVPGRFFQSGTYTLSFYLIKDRREAVFVEKDFFSFTVADGGREIGSFMGREPGFIRPNFPWQNA